jgi:hypothetical protein
VPLWLAVAWTLLVGGIIVVYWVRYGPANFLWFSDIALIGSVPALWLEDSLLASALAVGVVIPELFWNVSYILRLLTGRRLSGLTDYMWDASLPAWLRALSLFHVPLPAVLLWMVWEFGYHDAAPVLMTAIAWVVLPLCYRLTPPEKNINWAFGWGGEGARTSWHPLAYLAAVMAAAPLVLYLPSHLLLRTLFSG